jgi:hypothetical protein
MFDESVKVLSALLTPVLAITTGYIAWRQWRTNDLKLRHDLYERRLAIYLSVIEFLARIMSNCKATDAEMINFLQKTRESYFLFGPKVAAYLDSIYKRSVDLQYHNTMLHDPASSLPIGDERKRLAHEQCEALKWCSAQLEITRKKFAEYMRLA